jgi:hypothetical protein
VVPGDDQIFARAPEDGRRADGGVKVKEIPPDPVTDQVVVVGQHIRDTAGSGDQVDHLRPEDERIVQVKDVKIPKGEQPR